MSTTQSGTTRGEEHAGGVTEVLSEQATKVKEESRRKVREGLDQRTTEIGQEAQSLASTLRRHGTESRISPSGVDVSGVTSGVADRIERAGAYLERKSGDEMLTDAERFVRTRPWMVAGAAAIAGFALSRLLKASSERRYDPSATAADRAQHGEFVTTPTDAGAYSTAPAPVGA